jgi:hypothetical protein
MLVPKEDSNIESDKLTSAQRIDRVFWPWIGVFFGFSMVEGIVILSDFSAAIDLHEAYARVIHCTRRIICTV